MCRVLNAFLNTGVGGVAYLGVLDDGTVKGLRLSHYQVAVRLQSTAAASTHLLTCMHPWRANCYGFAGYLEGRLEQIKQQKYYKLAMVWLTDL